MSSWAFTAIGIPASQGSKKHVGRGIMIESSKALRPWRDTVTAAAFGAGEKILGPVAVHVVFTLPRPKSAPKRETLPQRGIDLDKSVRAAFDSVTAAGLWEDDSRVCSLLAEKRWPLDCNSLPVPGVVIAACETLSHNDCHYPTVLGRLVIEQHRTAWARYEGAA